MQQAAYALDFNVSRDDLKPEVQAAYDRLVEARREAVYALESRLSRDGLQPEVQAEYDRLLEARRNRPPESGSGMTEGAQGTVTIWHRGNVVLSADDHGVTVIRQLGNRRVAWAEISRFEDGGGYDSERGVYYWLLVVVLQTGEKVEGYPYPAPAPETAVAVRRVAERHGIPADVAGVPPGTGRGMTSVALRPATPADSEFCYQLHKAAMGGYITAIWGWDEQRQRDFHARSFNPGRWQIITTGGTDIGMIDVDHRPGEIYLSRIEVHPSYQGHFIGTRLIIALLVEAAHNGQDLVLDVLAVNHRAQSLYQRLGMTEVARHGDGNIKITMRSSRPGMTGEHPQDAASRTRQAEIVYSRWRIALGIAAAVMVALYAWDLSKPHANFSLAVLALIATLYCLFAAHRALERLQHLRKLEQAGETAPGIADTHDNIASPNDDPEEGPEPGPSARGPDARDSSL